jgi:hypothetical protein
MIGDSLRPRHGGWTRLSAALTAFGASLLTANAARAGEPKLAPDEAIVICKATAATLRNMEYWRVGQKDGFFVTMRGTLTPRVVKAGRYYLHTYSTFYRNIFPPTFTEPRDTTGTIDVLPGSVTYFGDVTATQIADRSGLTWRFAVALNPKTLLAAERAFPWVREYPLYVSKADGTSMRVRWSNDHEPSHGVSGGELYGSN